MHEVAEEIGREQMLFRALATVQVLLTSLFLSFSNFDMYVHKKKNKL